jgi:hypothetical protein
MRFLSVYKTEETNQPPTLEHVTRMQQLIEEGMKGGWLISTEGCLPSAKGARVRRTNGKTTVTDGPFTESKELVAGFAILEAASKSTPSGRPTSTWSLGVKSKARSVPCVRQDG